MRNKQTKFDTLTTGRHFDHCILTSSLPTGRQYANILVGGQDKPVIEFDKKAHIETNIVPGTKCDKNGINQDSRIFQLSERLRRSINFEYSNSQNDKRDWEFEGSNYKKYEHKAYVQTNFSQIWSRENRRQLVSLSIIYSLMNVCVQKITYSLIESKSRQNVACDKDKIFKCADNSDNITLAYNYSNEEDEDKPLKPKLIKIKRPTIEVSFEAHRGAPGSIKSQHCNFDSLKFSS